MKKFIFSIILLICLSISLVAQTSTTAFRFRRNASAPDVSGNGAEVYYDTVTNKFRFRDNSSWNDLDFSALLSGSGTSSRVAFWNGTKSLSSDSGFTFDSTNDDLTIGRDIIVGRNITFADGVRQTFNPNATNSGLNVGSHTANPSVLVNGDLWYNSTSNELNARINGTTVALGAGGGGSSCLQYIATLTQEGINPPVATVILNQLGGTVTYGYEDAGQYLATLTGAFIVNKTATFITSSSSVVFRATPIDGDNISIRVGSEDDLLNKSSFMIIVCP